MILDKTTADRKLQRMALEVAERNSGRSELILVGIRENGFVIAEKIKEYLQPVFPGKVVLISLSLDKKDPAEIRVSDAMDMNQRCILLIDDVANSGRTMLYALKPFLQQSPAQIETLALVERTHKKYPVAVNYVGLSVATTREEMIVVGVEGGEVTGAWIS